MNLMCLHSSTLEGLASSVSATCHLAVGCGNMWKKAYAKGYADILTLILIARLANSLTRLEKLRSVLVRLQNRNSTQCVTTFHVGRSVNSCVQINSTTTAEMICQNLHHAFGRPAKARLMGIANVDLV